MFSIKNHGVFALVFIVVVSLAILSHLPSPFGLETMLKVQAHSSENLCYMLRFTNISLSISSDKPISVMVKENGLVIFTNLTTSADFSKYIGYGYRELCIMIYNPGDFVSNVALKLSTST
ncbi:MAG: hypothetical protein ACP5I2_06135 [Fervidicoccaceae archaeon]|jgi:hypothetical protein